MPQPAHFRRRNRRRRLVAVAAVVVAAGAGIGGWLASDSGHNTPAASPTSVHTIKPPSSTASSVTSTSPSAPVAPTSSTSTGPAAPTTSPTGPAAGATPTSLPPVVDLVYVVQQGDNLWTIGTWFQMHGYTGLYSENMSAIGSNPNLIHIGLILRVTLSASDALKFKQTLPGVVTSHLTITNVTT